MNTLKTFMLMMVLSIILVLIGGVIGGQAGIVIALIFALLMNMGADWFSDRIPLGMTKSHPMSTRCLAVSRTNSFQPIHRPGSGCAGWRP